MFKVIGHMGDGLQNMLLGLISSILPKQNSIAKKISLTSKSNYFFQETIKSGHCMFPKLRIFEISACVKGCCAFIGANVDSEFCPICDRPNDVIVNSIIYYFPLADRLKSLLMSDLKRFFTYSKIRRPPTVGFLETFMTDPPGNGLRSKWTETGITCLSELVLCSYIFVPRVPF